MIHILPKNEFNNNVLVRNLRHALNYLQTVCERYPETPSELTNSRLYKSWWYYSVELLPGIIKKGNYPDALPFLPRILLRNCRLKHRDCLDIGSMEGLMPVLMCRQGAESVTATDAVFHCYKKLAAVQHYYNVDFKFRQVSLLYDLHRKISGFGNRGFDFINVSGVLYHVWSPLQVLAGMRPLLRKNGLMIISTNVVDRPDFSMEFNNAGKLQTEQNTFWYISIPLLDYLIRYFQLLPIDCLYLRNSPSDSKRYARDFDTGYLSVVCRAVDDNQGLPEDTWASGSMKNSWEYINSCDQGMLRRQPVSDIAYNRELDRRFTGADGRSIDLRKAVTVLGTVPRSDKTHDTHLLKREDQF